MPEQILYEFSEMMQNVYENVHEYLRNHDKVPNYVGLEFKQITAMLGENTMLSAAAQYYALFPTHYFKAYHFLENVIDPDMLLRWFTDNPRICLLDIGCGAGAASAAFLNLALKICQQGMMTNRIHIYCIGVDPNKSALALYRQVMNQLKLQLDDDQITLEFALVLNGLPETSALRDLLSKKLDQWQQPRISQVLTLQMNIVAPLSNLHYQNKDNQDFFDDFDVEIIDQEENFGEQVARRYEQLLREAKIDHLSIVTIGTINKDKKKHPLSDRVHEMTTAIGKIMQDAEHTQYLQNQQLNKVKFRNPKGSLFGDKYPSDAYETTYYGAANFITNKDFTTDERWHSILNVENLRLAWARARQNMMRESLYDETELRLFEQMLDTNLARLSRQLESYMRTIEEGETIYYKIPKSSDKVRPKGLTRLEEEILFAAIVQDISQEYNARYPRSYAFRINQNRGSGNEYLYEYWFTAYMQYISDAREIAEKYKNTVQVITTDLSKFFEKIIQQRLLEIASDELYKYSERIDWLLKNLLIRSHDQHETDKGVTQGSIGSGFFANVYLASLDRLFENWNVEFFRYVDDMTIIVHDDEEVDDVINALDKELEKLDLTRNMEKTHIYQSVEEFIEATKQNEQLNKIHEEYEDILGFLWVMDEQLRRAFAGAYHSQENYWWSLLKTYQRCLSYLSIYITMENLSRKITQYVFREKTRNKHLAGRSNLFFPNLPISDLEEDYVQWSEEFSESNSSYINRLTNLRKDLVSLFHETIFDTELNEITREKRQIIRFSVNRLAVIGLKSVAREVELALIQAPWLLEASYLFEYMAMEGLYDSLLSVLNYYMSEDDQITHEYMVSMIIRAVRYYPNVDIELWNTLFDYAIESPSLTVKIMATETILVKRYSQPELTTADQDDRIQAELLSKTLTNNRLRKNYMLILGENLNTDQLPDIFEDNLLRSAKNVALNSPLAFDLFDAVEPDIIRRKYYSSTSNPTDQPSDS